MTEGMSIIEGNSLESVFSIGGDTLGMFVRLCWCSNQSNCNQQQAHQQTKSETAKTIQLQLL